MAAEGDGALTVSAVGWVSGSDTAGICKSRSKKVFRTASKFVHKTAPKTAPKGPFQPPPGIEG